MMVLLSRRSLTDMVAREQIAALSDFCDGLMRPDKCGEFEPIRTPFDPADISKPIEWLAQPFGEFFYQKGRPIHVSGAMWNLDRGLDSRFPSPLFANYWTVHFDGKWAKKVGIEKIEGFVSEMFRLRRLSATWASTPQPACPAFTGAIFLAMHMPDGWT